MTDCWLTFSAKQARDNSREAKESNDIYVYEKLINSINKNIKEACSLGLYECSVKYESDISAQCVQNVEDALISNGYKVKRSTYNGWFGTQLIINWEE